MKHAILFVALLTMPGISFAQHRVTGTPNCPLSYWSTTGAACKYAPELPASEEAQFKMMPPVRNSWQIERLNLLPYTTPKPEVKIVDTSFLHSMRELMPDSLLRKMAPTLSDAALWHLIHWLPAAEIRDAVPDSTVQRVLKDSVALSNKAFGFTVHGARRP